MSPLTRASYQSSELSRSSAQVFAAAAEQPVAVTRRDGETLVLMSEREDRARSELLALAAQLIGAATQSDGTLTDYMSDHYPWMLALSTADQHSCAHEVLDSARASFALEQPHLAVAALTAWRETAEAQAAGLGSSAIDWLDEDEPVGRP